MRHGYPMQLSTQVVDQSNRTSDTIVTRWERLETLDYTLKITVSLLQSALAVAWERLQPWTVPFLRVPDVSPASATRFPQQQLTATESQQSSLSLTHSPTNQLFTSLTDSESELLHDCWFIAN
jgi:hypothetical protein